MKRKPSYSLSKRRGYIAKTTYGKKKKTTYRRI